MISCERPDVVLAFHALAVGILGRMERAVAAGHPAQNVVHGLAGDLREPGIAGQLIGFEVNRAQKRVVVEHFLEMGREPALVGRIAGEAAAQVIVDPTAGHLVERMTHDMKRLVVLGAQVVPQQNTRRSIGWGNLGALPNPP